jgi:hypothetical protein
MILLSDTVTFPVMQISLLIFCFIAFSNSGPTIPPDQVDAPALTANATLLRGEPSMKALGAAAGFAIVVITLINGSAFNNERFWLKDFSVLINVLDTLAVLYLCFWCGWSRTKILGIFEQAKTDK